MVLDSLLSQIQDILSAPRWAYPDSPGSANVPRLTTRLTPEQFQSLRAVPEGAFLLDLLDLFEEALNDDWLPFELAGLPLPKAREFLSNLAGYMREHQQLAPVEQARAMHRALAELVA
ncbi:hypothetical protein [Cognatilysobacter bugurensis]|uniref:Uncharacterized protein n=1 Tax=Cognatilysobacter bugurensis TaxID=543356 RepID=A0A918SXR3_9GAMM|nr:hypothetical protein [Lysobacter bugurensis]GHA76698.1 hypothetical protein GCM10007067_12460 [Lysobacter bugurensis]